MSDIEKPRKEEKFCQQASERYERLLEEASGDPRSVAGTQAMQDVSWRPTIDARDARVTGPEGT